MNPETGTETESDVVIVFIPPLGEILERAQQLKGSQLTEEEVLKIRDNSTCIAMESEVARKGAESRGFKDVDPENCWVDWHRFRVDRSGAGPTVVLCIPGSDDLEKRTRPILKNHDVELEYQDRDPRVIEAFNIMLINPSPDESEKISAHKKVLYLSSHIKTAEDAPMIAGRLVSIVSSVLDATGTPAKCESSGIAHSQQTWFELSEMVKENVQPATEFWASIFQAFVQYPIMSDKDFYSCGMHLLGHPDVIISNALLKKILDGDPADIQAAAYLFSTFCLYLLIECTEFSFAPGHTFRPAEDWPPIRVRWEPCTAYKSDDLFFNPYGMWRFAELNDAPG